MNTIFALLALVAVLLASPLSAGQAGASAAGAAAAPVITHAGKPIADHYIVVLKRGNAEAVAAAAGVTPRYVYSAAINGFAAQLTPAQLAALQRNPNVEYIEQDNLMSLDATQLMDAAGQPWGLDRIDQQALPLSSSYTYNADGSSVSVYVIDTGLQPDHAEFDTRAANVYDAFGGTGEDCHGHGTHVGGTIGGRTFGVAKSSLLRGVRVLDCNGSGSMSGVIAGVDWVRKHYSKPAVANMSLGGGLSRALNRAVKNLVSAGVFVAVAAGNSNINACNVSPASVTEAYTVAASDSSDTRAAFSNFGSCVDGYAPGVAIKSAWIGGGTHTISGTSMAAPHVAGVAALYKSHFGDTSQAVLNGWIDTTASSGVISGNPGGTPNLLLFTGGL